MLFQRKCVTEMERHAEQFREENVKDIFFKFQI